MEKRRQKKSIHGSFVGLNNLKLPPDEYQSNDDKDLGVRRRSSSSKRPGINYPVSLNRETGRNQPNSTFPANRRIDRHRESSKLEEILSNKVSRKPSDRCNNFRDRNSGIMSGPRSRVIGTGDERFRRSNMYREGSLSRTSKIALSLDDFRDIDEGLNLTLTDKSESLSFHEDFSTSMKLSQNYAKCKDNKDKLSIFFFKELTKKNNDLLIKLMTNAKDEIAQFFTSPVAIKDVMVIIELGNKICSINRELIKNDLLYYILNSVEFLDTLEKFIENVIVISIRTSEINQNMTSIISFIGKVIEYIPNNKITNFNSILMKAQKILEDIDISLPNLEIIKKCKSILSLKYELLEDELVTYKSLRPFPTKNDFLIDNAVVDKNIVTGPYNNVSHYIDVQFKLLREDFLAGLRSGIRQYKKQLKDGTKTKNHDLSFYNNTTYVGIIDKDFPGKALLHEFQLDTNNKFLNKTQWDVSRRLIHGSLLLFSNDNFENFFTAILEDRIGFEPKKDKNDNSSNVRGSKNISVVIIGGKKLRLKHGSKFIMVEPKVLFTPYFLVMNALQKFHPQMFPLEKYIINVETSCMQPKYMQLNATQRHGGYIINDVEMSLDKLSSLQNPESIGLNKSQLSALHAALTREFVLIQGPPGTGKTYLGIQIIDILLNNKDKWSDGKSPIFIACYRNHAVDQILESLTVKGHGVVRLGGRSDNEELKKCNLKNTVGHKRDPIIRHYLNELRDELEDIKMKIKELDKFRKFINEKRGILCVNIFESIMTADQFKYLSRGNAYENWLLEGNDSGPIVEFDLFEKGKRKKEATFDHPFILLSVGTLENELRELYDNYLFEIEKEYHEFDDMRLDCKMLTGYMDKYQIFQKLVNRLKENLSKTPIEILEKSDLRTLSIQDRWTLYNNWANKFTEKCESKVGMLMDIFDIKLLEYIEKRDSNDGENLKSSKIDIIGATTTGAARLNNLLRAVKPKIVIIEEAAEVLETHAITSLTEHCEQLILIGDHKQLRPSPASYTSVCKYQMDVSLFERMIKNGMECFTLTEQHRMRPEISKLVVPNIYEELSNHPSVETYPDMNGMKTNLYFVDHNISEDELDPEEDSHRNVHEAHFILALADYIIKQGYEKKSITILTTYAAQLLYMKSVVKFEKNLVDVDIQVVDNFQGQENDIILLSLVRSNSSTIGFLSKENRVCVALTRAKQGFFIVGNMETLQTNSFIWKKMQKTLEENHSIGEVLPLKCVTHKRVTNVKTSQDFTPLVNGGCTKECGMELECGHTCDIICHGYDLNHEENFSCKKPCKRRRNCNIHFCSSECGKQCPPCEEKIPELLKCGHEGYKICAGKILPCKSQCSYELQCGHSCKNDCHWEKLNEHSNMADCNSICGKPNESCPYQHECPKKCNEVCGECTSIVCITLKCGHISKGMCKDVCGTQCEVLVEKTLPCDHIVQAPCSQPIEETICREKKITTHLFCDHTVEIHCSDDLTEIKCDKIVAKGLKCGHIVECICSSSVDDIICPEKVLVSLPCGHLNENAPCSVPIENVDCNVEVPITLKCGHPNIVECSSQNSKTLKCSEKCEIILKCGHKCSGLCGEACNKCEEGISITDYCGHTRKVPCSTKKNSKVFEKLKRNDCRLVCNQTLPCNHNCKGTCGKCMQGRLHQTCSAECSKKLICGHVCSRKCWVDFHNCVNKCPNACKHKICEGQCGDICKKCFEPCDWLCIHHRCTKKCWEMCNRDKCTLPCKIPLPCGHDCFGYCGEPCPQLCLICSNNKKYDISDRLILLEDCNHIISQKELSTMIKENVGLLQCPECEVAIVRTGYLRLETKKFFLLYSKISRTAMEKYNNFNKILSELRNNFSDLSGILGSVYEGCESLNKLLEFLLNRCKAAMVKHSKHQKRDKLQIKTLLFICLYVTEALIMTRLEEMTDNHKKVLLEIINELALYLFERKVGISTPEMHMFSQELSRLQCLIKLMKLKEDPGFIQSGAEDTDYYKNANNSILSLCEFTPIDKNNTIENLKRLNKFLHSNFNTSTVDESSLKITKFLGTYYPIFLHKSNWHKCGQGHCFYTPSNLGQNVCPFCSNRLSDINSYFE